MVMHSLEDFPFGVLPDIHIYACEGGLTCTSSHGVSCPHISCLFWLNNFSRAVHSKMKLLLLFEIFDLVYHQTKEDLFQNAKIKINSSRKKKQKKKLTLYVIASTFATMPTTLSHRDIRSFHQYSSTFINLHCI